MIMERKLLAQDGIILADNVLALGCTVDSKIGTPHDPAVRNGAELRKFNDHIAEVHIPNNRIVLIFRTTASMFVFYPCLMALH